MARTRSGAGSSGVTRPVRPAPRTRARHQVRGPIRDQLARQIGLISGPHQAAREIQDLRARVDTMNDINTKVVGMYKVLQKENQRMKTNIISHMMISRRLQDDVTRLEARIDVLSAARYYLGDKIDDQAKTISNNREVISDLELKLKNYEAKMLQEKSQEDSQEEPRGEGELDKEQESANAKIDPVTYQLAKDSRLKAISTAVESLKMDLLWGRFSGTSSELEDLFKEVQELL